jgi:hypothetical protein
MSTHLYHFVPLFGGCIHGVDWYSGIIVFASASQYTYHIRYDDGTIEEDVNPKLVRRFQPYQINEIIEVDVSGTYDTYIPSRIRDVHGIKKITIEYVDFVGDDDQHNNMKGTRKLLVVASAYVRRKLNSYEDDGTLLPLSEHGKKKNDNGASTFLDDEVIGNEKEGDSENDDDDYDVDDANDDFENDDNDDDDDDDDGD